jgi:predicted lactoylglutathione lyase
MKMNYFVLGTNDMHASKAFYDGLFASAGLQTMSPSDRMTYWLSEDFAFAIATPFNEAPATNGNGTMVGFCVGTKEDVERMHGLALELGGTCEGTPGQRGPKFSAYVRDLDGNKLCLSD